MDEKLYEAEMKRCAAFKRELREAEARCDAPHPDWDMTCWRKPHPGDEAHECSGVSWEGPGPGELGTFGEYLGAYTARGGMTDDERTAYWMSWTRLVIIWAIVLVVGLVVMESFGGLAGDGGALVAIYAAIVLGWQGVEAVRFARWARRGGHGEGTLR